jgi:hypothetical protein
MRIPADGFPDRGNDGFRCNEWLVVADERDLLMKEFFLGSGELSKLYPGAILLSYGPAPEKHAAPVSGHAVLEPHETRFDPIPCSDPYTGNADILQLGGVVLPHEVVQIDDAESADALDRQGITDRLSGLFCLVHTEDLLPGTMHGTVVGEGVTFTGQLLYL